MTESDYIALIDKAAEDWFGIKADPGDAKKFVSWLLETHGKINHDIINEVFSSGDAAAFLTVNETYFFREPLHFSFLLDFLPFFQKSGKNSILRICTAGVATGCEAYSIAMLIEAHNRDLAVPLLYHIDAFDINPKVIQQAIMGSYGQRSLREDGSSFHYLTDRYLKKEERFYIDSILKKNICFFVHNLMNELPKNDYDLIFFRNAFIYFTPRNRERILSNLSSALIEGGILIMGVSETSGVQHSDLESKNINDVFYFIKQKSVVE